MNEMRRAEQNNERYDNYLIEGMVNQYGCFPPNTEFDQAVQQATDKFMVELTPTLDAMPTMNLVIASNFISANFSHALAPYVLQRQVNDSKKRRAAALERKTWNWACREMLKIADESEKVNWVKAIEDSEDATFQFQNGRYRVDFDYIGEGNSGDYDPDDPNDVPRLRFYVMKWNDDTEEHDEMDDSSWCTLMTPLTPVNLLELFAKNLLDAALSISPDRELQHLTWTTEQELQEVLDNES